MWSELAQELKFRWTDIRPNESNGNSYSVVLETGAQCVMGSAATSISALHKAAGITFTYLRRRLVEHATLNQVTSVLRCRMGS